MIRRVTIRSRFVLSVGAAMLGLSALAACGGSDDKPAADNDDWWVTDPQGVAIHKRIDAASRGY